MEELTNIRWVFGARRATALPFDPRIHSAPLMSGSESHLTTLVYKRFYTAQPGRFHF